MRKYYRSVKLVLNIAFNAQNKTLGLNTEFNAQNKTLGLNTLAIPVISYNLNIINWKISELRNLDRKTRKLLTTNRNYYPKADIDRIYLPGSEGGRRLRQIVIYYKMTTTGLAKYWETKNGRLTPHWSLAVHAFLNSNLPKRWLGCAGQDDDVFCNWPG